MKIFNLSFIVLFVFFVQPLSAQLTPEEAVEEMGRGINLGNTLEPPTEGGWNNGPAQESFFDAYLEAGFTNIRIPVRWDQHTANTAPFAITESWMNRVEQVVDWGLSRGFIITLNGHHEDWLKNNYNNATLRARYDSIWVQIAERFQDKSDRLLFEMINEPKGMTSPQVDNLNERILGIIRTTNPTRIVIYSGNMYSNAEQLLSAAIPDDDYIIGYYHAYDPWAFSGQGIGTWGTSNDYQQVTNKYQTVKNWSVANNIPIHHSEFGAIHTCDFNSRMRIYAHNVEQCIAKGFAFSVWDDGGDFRVLNRGSNTWPEVKEILVHYYEDSPNEIFATFTPDPNSVDPSVVVTWNNRTSSSNNIILERSINATNNYVQIADLPAGTETYTDLNVAVGNTYTYRMYTTREDGTLLHGYPSRASVTAIAEKKPFNENPIDIPGVLEIEEFDFGGEGLSYHDTDPANIPSAFRIDEGVDIGALGNGFILEYVAVDEWLEYTVNVSKTGTYSIKAEAASEVANGAFNITFDKNSASANFSTPSTGAWYTFTEITANSTIELEAGEQLMRLNITNTNPFNLDRLTFKLESTTQVDEIDYTEKGFSISPNPTDGILNIDLLDALVDKDNHLELFRLTGEKVGSFRMDGKSNLLDLSNFANGSYLLRLANEDTNIIQRIVKY